MVNYFFLRKRPLRAAEMIGVVLGVIIALVMGPVGNWQNILLGAVGGGILGHHLLYLFCMNCAKIELDSLKITEDALKDSGVVLLTSPGGVVHYKSGYSSLGSGTALGKLFLTNQALVFRGHSWQQLVYQLIIPLDDILHVEPIKFLWFFWCGLHIYEKDGTVESFNMGFGNGRGWVSAITAMISMNQSERIELANSN